MLLAVTYENGEVFQHFGHTRQFKLYLVRDGAVESEYILDTNGSGHGALATLLEEERVEALICGGIGGGAVNALAEAGIVLYPGVDGSADEAVQAWIRGDLKYCLEANCGHHGDHGNHGEPACGEQPCGQSCH